VFLWAGGTNTQLLRPPDSSPSQRVISNQSCCGRDQAAATAPAYSTASFGFVRSFSIDPNGLQAERVPGMTRKFPQGQHAHSIALNPYPRTRRSTNVIVIVILVQSVALASLGWDAPAVISIIVATAAVLRSTRVFCPQHD
jgi:hypothetical protein